VIPGAGTVENNGLADGVDAMIDAELVEPVLVPGDTELVTGGSRIGENDPMFMSAV
jgi:hypothetical protein